MQTVDLLMLQFQLAGLRSVLSSQIIAGENVSSLLIFVRLQCIDEMFGALFTQLEGKTHKVTGAIDMLIN